MSDLIRNIAILNDSYNTYVNGVHFHNIQFYVQHWHIANTFIILEYNSMSVYYPRARWVGNFLIIKIVRNII